MKGETSSRNQEKAVQEPLIQAFEDYHDVDDWGSPPTWMEGYGFECNTSMNMLKKTTVSMTVFTWLLATHFHLCWENQLWKILRRSCGGNNGAGGWAAITQHKDTHNSSSNKLVFNSYEVPHVVQLTFFLSLLAFPHEHKTLFTSAEAQALHFFFCW